MWLAKFFQNIRFKVGQLFFETPCIWTFVLENWQFNHELAFLLLLYHAWKTNPTTWQNMKARGLWKHTSLHEKQFHQTLLFQQQLRVYKRGCTYTKVQSGAPPINPKCNIGPSPSDVLVIIIQVDPPLGLEKLWDKASLSPSLSFKLLKLENLSFWNDEESTEHG